MTPFSRRLFIDTIRRAWLMYAMAFLSVLGVSAVRSKAALDGVDLGVGGDAVAWSLAATWFVAFVPMVILEQREIARLPVSRREFWIVRCWLSAIIPAAMSAVMLSLAALVSPTTALDSSVVVLATCYSFLYGGCFLAVTIFTGPLLIGATGFWGVTRVLIYVFGFLLGGAVWPFVFTKYLPHTFAEFGGPTRSVLIAAAGITIATFFYQPRIVTRASRPTFKRNPAASPVRRGALDRLTGLRFLFWKEARQPLAFVGGTLLMSIAYWRAFEPGTSAFEFFSAGKALLFAPAVPRAHEAFPVLLMLLITGAAPDGDLIRDMRRMRALPLSTSQLAALVTSMGLLFAVLLWVCLLAVHAVVVGTWPVTLRPDLFMLIAGAIAMTTTVRLALPGSGIVKAVGAGLFMGPTFAFQIVYGPPGAALRIIRIAIGALALFASFLINTWSMRNSARMYKPQGIATLFGGVPPQAP